MKIIADNSDWPTAICDNREQVLLCILAVCCVIVRNNVEFLIRFLAECSRKSWDSIFSIFSTPPTVVEFEFLAGTSLSVSPGEFIQFGKNFFFLHLLSFFCLLYLTLTLH